MARYKTKRITVRVPEDELGYIVQAGGYKNPSEAIRDALSILGDKIKKEKEEPNIVYREIRLPRLLYNRAESAIASGEIPAVNLEDAILFLLRDYLRNVEGTDRNQKTLDDYAQA